MKKICKKIKEKPILFALIIASIIGLFCISINLVKYYQPETEMPPKLIVKDDNGEEVELLLLGYDWTYKGEHKIYNFDTNVNNLVTHNFNAQNTLFTKYSFNGRLNGIEIFTNPKYKVKKFMENVLQYNPTTEDYESFNSSLLNEIGNTGFSFIPNTSTTISTFTLNSTKQGTAIYGLKIINQLYIDFNEIRNIRNLNLNNEEISNFMKAQTFGQYLNNVQIDNNRLMLTYDYYIPKDAILMFTNSLFALIDNLDEVEFTFSYNKYTKNMQDPITLNITKSEVDSLDSFIYSRNSFVDTTLDLTLEEFRSYIGK